MAQRHRGGEPFASGGGDPIGARTRAGAILDGGDALPLSGKLALRHVANKWTLDFQLEREARGRRTVGKRRLKAQRGRARAIGPQPVGGRRAEERAWTGQHGLRLRGRTAADLSHLRQHRFHDSHRRIAGERSQLLLLERIQAEIVGDPTGHVTVSEKDGARPVGNSPAILARRLQHHTFVDAVDVERDALQLCLLAITAQILDVSGSGVEQGLVGGRGTAGHAVGAQFEIEVFLVGRGRVGEPHRARPHIRIETGARRAGHSGDLGQQRGGVEEESLEVRAGADFGRAIGIPAAHEFPGQAEELLAQAGRRAFGDGGNVEQAAVGVGANLVRRQITGHEATADIAQNGIVGELRPRAHQQRRLDLGTHNDRTAHHDQGEPGVRAGAVGHNPRVVAQAGHGLRRGLAILQQVLFGVAQRRRKGAVGVGQVGRDAGVAEGREIDLGAHLKPQFEGHLDDLLGQALLVAFPIIPDASPPLLDQPEPAAAAGAVVEPFIKIGIAEPRVTKLCIARLRFETALPHLLAGPVEGDGGAVGRQRELVAGDFPAGLGIEGGDGGQRPQAEETQEFHDEKRLSPGRGKATDGAIAPPSAWIPQA